MTRSASRGTPARETLSAGPREWIGLAVLALPTLLLAMDVTVLYLAVPRLASELRPSGTELLWITDVYGFMIAGFLVAMGTLGDRIGRRRLLMIGAGAFAVASAAAAYAPSAGTLIAARALLGIAGATLMPSTLALISNMFRDPGQRGTAIGVWAACLSGGVALGPAAGGTLLESFWWGSVFLVAVPVMGVLMVTAPVLLPEYRDAAAGRVDVTSVVLSVAAMLAIVYGVKRIAHGGGVPTGLLIVLAGAAAGTAFCRRQRGLDAPLIELRLFRHRIFSTALVVLFLALAVTAGTYLFVTRFLQEVAGLSPLAAGLWLVPSAAAMIVTSMAAPALARRTSQGAVLGASLTISAAGFLALALLGPSGGLPLLIAGIVVVYIGQGPLMALGTDLVVGSAPPEKAGSASAVSETSTELGLAFGVATLGSVGTLVYRQSGPVPASADVPPDLAEAARGTIEGATTAAAQLPPRQAAELLGTAQQAFTDGLNAIAGIGAAVTLALAVLAVTALRRPRPTEPGTPRPRS